MLALKKIAVTGTVASGKSSVLEFFKELGAFIVDSDEIVRELLDPYSNIGKQIISRLGPEVVKSGRFDRRKMAEIVFNCPEQLKELESILHPAVLKIITDLHKEVEKRQTYRLFLAEIPLLFEIGAEQLFDQIITVKARPDIRRKRFMKSDFDARSSRQLSEEEKERHADYIIENNGSLEELKKKTFELYQLLIKKTMIQ